MNFTPEKIVKSARSLLVSRDKPVLEQTVEKLIEKCRVGSTSGGDADFIRKFHVSLLHESIHLNNLCLAQLALEQLGAKQMLAIIRGFVDYPPQEHSPVLEILSSYLQLNQPSPVLLDQTHSSPSIKHPQPDYEGLIEACVGDNWRLFNIEGTENKYLAKFGRLGECLVQGIKASSYEADENFNDAITAYEKAGMHREHLSRVTMKHLICSTHRALAQYCASSKELQGFWIKYLTMVGNFRELCEFLDESGIKSTRAKIPVDAQSHSIGSEITMNMLPKPLREFVEEPETSLMSLDHKRVRMLFDSVSSMDPSIKMQLSSNITRRSHSNIDSLETKKLSLCLGLKTKFLSMIRSEVSERLEMIERFGTSLDISQAIIDLNQARMFVNRRLTKIQQCHYIFNYSLRLGLIDQALAHVLSLNLPEINDNLQRAPEHMERALNSVSRVLLEQINPCIQEETLIAIEVRLKELDDRALATNVITTVIFSLTVFIFKLNSADKELINPSLAPLEIIFKHLQIYLENFAFNLSESLIRATNGLTTALKNNLDALADSEIIRESCRKLIETIAGRSMIEGRYKSAAMLYSHIEDNVNAIKSLMRTGEVETVINYALLVKDFTVNRITTNYLKHLKVDAETIEDFANRANV